jgi:hypothetical protein
MSTSKKSNVALAAVIVIGAILVALCLQRYNSSAVPLCGGVPLNEAVWQEKKKECEVAPDQRLKGRRLMGPVCSDNECSGVCVEYTLNPG